MSTQQTSKYCPFCAQTLPLADAPAIIEHSKICTTSLRTTYRNSLTTHAQNNITATYNAAQGTLIIEADGTSLQDDAYAAYSMKIFRMWRANELLDLRNDYQDQVVGLNVQPYDEREFVAVKGVLEQVLAKHESVLETVMAIQDFFAGRTDPYTSYDDSPIPSSDAFAEDQNEILKDQTTNTAPLARVIGLFDDEFPDSDFEPLEISHKILQFQNEQDRSDDTEEEDQWDNEQDEALLRLLGEGLPMVEVARRLNAHTESEVENYVPPRTLDEVKQRVEELLEPN